MFSFELIFFFYFYFCDKWVLICSCRIIQILNCHCCKHLNRWPHGKYHWINRSLVCEFCGLLNKKYWIFFYANIDSVPLHIRMIFTIPWISHHLRKWFQQKALCSITGYLFPWKLNCKKRIPTCLWWHWSMLWKDGQDIFFIIICKFNKTLYLVLLVFLLYAWGELWQIWSSEPPALTNSKEQDATLMSSKNIWWSPTKHNEYFGKIKINIK